jgi:hypothetical protein
MTDASEPAASNKAVNERTDICIKDLLQLRVKQPAQGRRLRMCNLIKHFACPKAKDLSRPLS